MSSASGFNITEPTDGKVVLTLNWQDAQILTRIVGRTNSGNLQEQSPCLYNFVLSMVDRIKREDDSEDYAVHVGRFGQMYVYPVED